MRRNFKLFQKKLPSAGQISNFKNFVIYLSFVIWILSFIAPDVLAADSTPSSTIQNQLNQLKAEIASKAARLKSEMNQKLTNKAYIGVIKSISESSITIAASSGARLVSINQDTGYENKLNSKKKFSANTISEDDYIAALGDVDETGVLTARQVVLLPEPDQPKIYLWGQIISVSDNLATLKLKGLKKQAAVLPKKTKVSPNDLVILTGTIGKNNIFDAGFVYVIPTSSAHEASKSSSL